MGPRRPIKFKASLNRGDATGAIQTPGAPSGQSGRGSLFVVVDLLADSTSYGRRKVGMISASCRVVPGEG